MEVAPSLNSLPIEILDQVLNQLPLKSLSALSTVSHALRGRLVSRLFRAIKITNFPQDDWETLRLLSSKYGQIPESLSFVGVCPPLTDSASPAQSHAGLTASLPQAVWQALSGKHFQQVREVRVALDHKDFVFVIDQERSCHLNISVDDMDETDLAMIEAKERQNPWRGLLASVWAALAENTRVRALTVDRLIAKPASSFFSSSWTRFLGQLETLQISLWSGPNPSAGKLNGSRHLKAHLDEHFFRHCSPSLSTLVLESTAGNIMTGACAQGINCVLPLDPLALAGLRRLELCNMVVVPELGSFVDASISLEILILKDCSVRLNGPMKSWALFFDMLGRQSHTLRNVEIFHPPLPLTSHEGGDFVDSWSDEERMTVVSSLRRAGRVAFPYAFTDGCSYPTADFGESENHLISWLTDETNYESYKSGVDDRAPAALLQRLDNNSRDLYRASGARLGSVRRKGSLS